MFQLSKILSLWGVRCKIVDARLQNLFNIFSQKLITVETVSGDINKVLLMNKFLQRFKLN